MSALVINALNIPEVIRKTLLNLDQSIDIEEYDPKATNGYVFFGKHKILNTEVVIKFYYWGGKAGYHAEPHSMTQINSPNVLSVSDAAYADSEWAYFVSPKCRGGDLDDLISKSACNNQSAIAMAEGIIQGASYLHAAKLLHRDLKPSNIYVQEGKPVIGDFGSLRRVPDGHSSVPASSHAILYRPPEAFGAGAKFEYRSDIYQIGLVFYQLLGGYLAYEPTLWMNKSEAKLYAKMDSDPDRSLFVDKCIERKILKGKIVDLEKLPAWVPGSLRKIIKRACNRDVEKRYENTADFLAAIHRVKGDVADWVLEDGNLTCRGVTSYQVSEAEGKFQIHKRRDGDWRRDNSFEGDLSLLEIVTIIDERNK